MKHWAGCTHVHILEKRAVHGYHGEVNVTGFEVSVKSELSVELGAKCTQVHVLGKRAVQGYHREVNVAGFEWMYCGTAHEDIIAR